MDNEQNHVGAWTPIHGIISSAYVCVWRHIYLHWISSCIGNLSGLTWVLWATTQVMSFPLSSAVGTIRYSLVTVTVLLAPGLGTVVALPLAVVSQVIWAAGRPSTDSQRATATGLVPSTTVMMEAEFWGLADGRMRGWRLDVERKKHNGREKIKGCRDRENRNKTAEGKDNVHHYW